LHINSSTTANEKFAKAQQTLNPTGTGFVYRLLQDVVTRQGSTLKISESSAFTTSASPVHLSLKLTLTTKLLDFISSF